MLMDRNLWNLKFHGMQFNFVVRNAVVENLQFIGIDDLYTLELKTCC